jgi:hypothetical protein
MPARFAISRDIATAKKTIETTTLLMREGFKIPVPRVFAVSLPANIAPKKTIIPNNPGIRLLRMAFAPKAAEKDGPVPLPPIFIAKNMAIKKGTNMVIPLMNNALLYTAKDSRITTNIKNY